MDKKTLTIAVAAAALATLGSNVSAATEKSAQEVATAKQAQAAALLKSMGSIVAVTSSPECNQ